MGWFTDSKFAFCRGIANHAWHFPPELNYEGKQLTLTLHCDHCGAARKDRVNHASGEVRGRQYTYQEGYLLDLQGAKRPEKTILRRDGLRLLIDEARQPVSNVKRLHRKTTAAA
jgi:hypothetical protein